MGSINEPYVAIIYIKLIKYSYAFWSNPYELFTDGPKINSGDDFGLKSSLFEAGGIVQREFFIACTPVIVLKQVV